MKPHRLRHLSLRRRGSFKGIPLLALAKPTRRAYEELGEVSRQRAKTKVPRDGGGLVSAIRAAYA